MAYCRWGGDSDLYVYSSIYGGFFVGVAGGEGVNVKTAEETLQLLLDLREKGHKVPDCAIDRLKREIEDANNLH